MAQNITLLGASYSDVPAVLLPKTGGGTARFDDATVTTATASDVASGKIFLANDGTITTGTASGGGGASNVVTGTFKGTTTAAAMDITLNYSGSGYPVAAVIYPKDGVKGNSSFNALVQRYVAAMFCVTKAYAATIPQYNKTTSVDEYIILHRYKSSTSSASTYSQTGNQTYIATGVDATSTNINIMNFKSKTKMSVFIASTSYGFAANIEYTYWVIYSS